jgi:hypothetical protein
MYFEALNKQYSTLDQYVIIRYPRRWMAFKKPIEQPQYKAILQDQSQYQKTLKQPSRNCF